MASKDTEAALQFMAGLIGGYAGVRERKQERKRRDQQDAEDRAWREWQQRQADLDRQFREEQARQTREEQARDNARQEYQWSQERIDSKTREEENRNLQFELRGIDAAEREKLHSEQRAWQQEGRDWQRLNDQISDIDAEANDIKSMWFSKEDQMWLDPSAESRFNALQLQRKQLRSGGGQIATGASPATMPDTRWDSVINDIAKDKGVDPQLMKAIMLAESGGDPSAKSPKGASGIMQFMPATAALYGVNPNDANVQDDFAGAAQMISDLNKITGGDLDKTLAAYNWGIGNVQKQGMGAMPKETVDYLKKVKGLMGASPTDNSFVSNLAQGSGLAEKKLTTSQKKELLQKIEITDDQIKTIEMSGDQSPAVQAEKMRLIKIKEGFQGQLVPELNPPAPEPTVAAGAEPATAPKDTGPQSGLDWYERASYNRVARKEGFETGAGQSVNPTGAFDVMKALEKGLMTPIPNEQLRSPAIYTDRAGSRVKWDSIINAELQKDPILKYSGYSLDNFIKYRDANPNMSEQAAFLDFTRKAKASVQPGQPGWQAASSGEAVYPRNPIDPTGLGIFVGLGGPGMIKPPMFSGGGGSSGMGWQAEQSLMDDAFNIKVNPLRPENARGPAVNNYLKWLEQQSGYGPEKFTSNGITGGRANAGYVGQPKPMQYSDAITGGRAFVPGNYTPSQPIESGLSDFLSGVVRDLLGDTEQMMPRPPMALPAPPPQGSVINLPGPAPLPYDIPMNPDSLNLLARWINSQRIGY